MPKVSLVVPVYNVEQYLEQCLRSAMNQTERDIEIIVVNDGSPDRSQDIIDRLAAEDPRIVAVQQENGGYGRAVNNGLARATGDWLFILESDDYLDPYALEVLLDRGERGGYDIVKGGFVREFPDGTTGRYSLEALTDRYEGRVRPLEDPRIMTMESSIWSAIYRADFIREQGITMLESSGAAYQDLVWKFLTFTLARSIYFVDYPVYHYRAMAIGSSSRSDRNPLAHFTNYAHLRGELEAHGRFRGDVVGLYYAHNLMDFNFHLGRLSDGARKEFAVAARETLANVQAHLAARGSLTSDPEFDVWLRAYTNDAIRMVTGRSSARIWKLHAKTPFSRRLKAGVKRRIIAVLRRAAGNRYARAIVDGYRRTSEGRPPASGTTMLPRISMPQGFTGRNALVVVPWSDENGSMRIIDLVNQSLRDLGYQLHVVAYNKAGGNPSRDTWTYFYDLPHARNFEKMHIIDGELVLDGHSVDDWAGDDLVQFVRSLDDAWHFDAIVCHYVFLSRVLEFVNPKASRILVTHDRFAGRNTRFAESGMKDSFYFSTTEDEEAKGLARADHVVALQEDEAEYFRGILGESATRVHTVPVFEPPSFLPERERSGPLRVGYIGSSYINNKTALSNFFSDIDLPPSDEIEFVVAGRVTRVLEKGDVPRGVTVGGDVGELSEFYSSVDVVINPDYFASGRKIKAFEGLAFGLPVLTTAESTTGFEDVPDDMRFESNDAILARLRELATDPEAYRTAVSAARAAYLALYNRYRTDTLLYAMIDGDAENPTTPAVAATA
jgi:glycosyltransferase involved in cell wall biosynthesis